MASSDAPPPESQVQAPTSNQYLLSGEQSDRPPPAPSGPLSTPLAEDAAPHTKAQDATGGSPRSQLRLPSSQSAGTLGSSFMYEKVQTTVLAWLESDGKSLDPEIGNKQDGDKASISRGSAPTTTSHSYQKVDKDHLSAAAASYTEASPVGGPQSRVSCSHVSHGSRGEGVTEEGDRKLLAVGEAGEVMDAELEGKLLACLPPDLRKSVERAIRRVRLLGWSRVTMGCGLALLTGLLLSSWQTNAALRSSVRGRDAEMAKLLIKLFTLQEGATTIRDASSAAAVSVM